tara:strand:+ start:2282 stop:2425 length:144 start_codon:yes stop_codon:yes gene_type:complete
MLSSKAAIVTRQNRQQHRPCERFDVRWPQAFADTFDRTWSAILIYKV